MDLLKKVRDSFSRTEYVYIEKSTANGPVFTIDVHGFGEVGNPDDYVNCLDGVDKFRIMLIRLYREVLHKDPNWHYFMEGTYNHIRFSLDFWEEIQEILDLHEADYSEPTVWIDAQTATRKYQDIFQQMFHTFSLLAVQQYDEEEIHMLLDRVIHCFINHQVLFLPKMCDKHKSLLEPVLVGRYNMGRAWYIGKLEESQRMIDEYNARLAYCREEMEKKVHEYHSTLDSTLEGLEDRYQDLLKDYEQLREEAKEEETNG